MYYGIVGDNFVSDHIEKHILNIFEQIWTQFNLQVLCVHLTASDYLLFKVINRSDYLPLPRWIFNNTGMHSIGSMTN